MAAAWPTVAADGQFAPRCGQRHLGWSRIPTGPGGDRSRRRPLPSVGPRTRRRKLPDQSVAGYTEVTWAEDRATRGRDPSAERRAKTGVGGRTPPLGIPGIGRKAINKITCICISEWRSENQGLSRARRVSKVAGSKAIMPGCMRFRRTTCAALMVLQKRPCFCSPAARPDICPDLRGETGQHGAKPCPLIWPLGTATHDAAIAGCLPPILAPADADLPGKPDPADRAAGLDRVERDPFESARTSARPMRAVS